jgi:hypothetical protein
LGSLDGASAFEERHGIMLPTALREFYGCISLACFLEVSGDGEVFLGELAECLDNPDLPPLIEWSSGRYIVVGFHGHSGCVCAVALEGQDPPTVWGFMDEVGPFDRTADKFSDWIFRGVDGYEGQLDYWQRVWEKCSAVPAEARRLGGVEWIRRMPGMSARLNSQTEPGAGTDQPRE